MPQDVTKYPCPIKGTCPMVNKREGADCIMRTDEFNTIRNAGCHLISEQSPTERRKELINHPEHYGGKDNPYEVIKVNKAWATEDEFYGWLKLTIITYLGRMGKKDPPLRDIGKVIWYSNYLSKWLEETGYKPK